MASIGETEADVKEVEICAADAGSIIDDIRNAINDFAGWNFIGGIQSLGGVINLFPGLLSSCEAGFVELADILGHLFDPNLGWYIFWNAIGKGPALIGAIGNAINDFDAGDYYNFGV